MSKSKKLYAYLKEKYGIPETEFFNEEDTILQRMKIVIPGLSKRTEGHIWSIHLEITNDDQREDLIIGQNWKDRNSAWSRFIEITDCKMSSPEDYSYLKLRLIGNIFLGEDQDLNDLKVLICVFEDFMKTI